MSGSIPAAPSQTSSSQYTIFNPWQQRESTAGTESTVAQMQALLAMLPLQLESSALDNAYKTQRFQDIMAQRAMYKGVRAGDPKQLNKYFGLSKGASGAERQPYINQFVTGSSQIPQTAAQGGLMSLRKFAAGGSNKKKTTTPAGPTFIGAPDEASGMPEQILAQPTKPADTTAPAKAPVLKPLPAGATPEQRFKRLDDYAKAGGKLNAEQQQYVNYYNATTAAGEKPKFNVPKGWKPSEAGGGGGGAGTTPPGKDAVLPPPVAADKRPIAGVVQPIDPNTGLPDYSKDPTITSEALKKAIDYGYGMKAPEEWGQAGQMYQDVYSGIGGLTGYRPQDVAYQNASALSAQAQQAAAERATAAQMAGIANISAERVNAGQYRVNASQMERPEDVAAREIAAERIAGARMEKPEDVQAKALQRYQMDGVTPISTEDLMAYQMEGPGSWTDEGVSSKYMSPYMQGVIDISKREAERDYTKQMNALAAKAKSAGAFGGSRQALERAEAQRNYNQQLQDIQTKGLQQAYESGRSQYGQELSLSQQAALQNLQSKLSTQSQSSQQALQAMLANQSIDYQTKVQNLQAMLGVQSQEAQQMLNAAMANQQAGLTTNQQNLQAEMQKQLANQQTNLTAAQANQQALLQAALANQQVGFGTAQTNAQLAQQAGLANAQYGLQGDIANQSAALQAALANQQTQFGVGSLNANLANQAALQNAQLGTQVSLQNANLGTQAAMQNAQLGTQVNLANSQAALQAAMANQQAGLAGANLNLNAYGLQGNMAQGLGSIGNQQAAWQQQQFNNLVGIGQGVQGLGQQGADAYQQWAQNLQNKGNLSATS